LPTARICDGAIPICQRRGCGRYANRFHTCPAPSWQSPSTCCREACAPLTECRPPENASAPVSLERRFLPVAPDYMASFWASLGAPMDLTPTRPRSPQLVAPPDSSCPSLRWHSGSSASAVGTARRPPCVQPRCILYRPEPSSPATAPPSHLFASLCLHLGRDE
jgi:hypothetical protein